MIDRDATLAVAGQCELLDVARSTVYYQPKPTPQDDIDLMRNSNAFVTGAVEPDEFDQLVAALRITCLFVTTVRPLFAHPVLSAVFSSGLPIAYFDWSMGNNRVNKMDLALHPGSSLENLIDGLNRWVLRCTRLNQYRCASQ